MLTSVIRGRYKRWALLSALLAIILLALLTLSSRPPAIASAITITFFGYTNAQPGNNWRFALFSISNQAPYTVRGYADSVEVEGVPDHKGPAIHPAYFPPPELKAGQSMLMAVGEPYGLREYGLAETGRWRFAMSFARCTWRTWWLDKSLRGRLPFREGLYPTNQVAVTTAWLTK
jgi:hypothetical protein